MFNGEVIEDYFQPAGGASKLSKRRRLHSTTTSDNREEGHQREPQRPAVEKQKQQDSDTRGTPRHGYEYSPVYLGELKAGPQRINFTARIVNIYDVKNTYAAADSTTTSGSGGRKRGGRGAKKSEEATATMPTSNARGCLKILAKDDSGCILINLWYAEREYEDVLVGSLVSVWTTHVSAPKAGLRKTGPTAAPSTRAGAAAAAAGTPELPAPLTMSIFPERDRTCRLHVHAHGHVPGSTGDDNNIGTRCRIPLGYSEGGVRFWGLEPLADVLARNGANSEGSKVLVYVKAIGSVERYVNAQGIPTEKLDVGLADESGEVILALFGRMLSSAVRTWVPTPAPAPTPHSRAMVTVLLISNASWKSAAARRLAVTSRTTVEVDPDIVEAGWLRKFAENAERLVNPGWPEGVFDVEAFENSATRIKFTLKEIDEFVRSAPTETFMGYASVMITEINLASLYKEGRLFCAECCNMPIFANALSGACGQCGKENELVLNPQIIGSLTDETGTISISSSLDGHASPTKTGISKQHINPKAKRSRGGSSPLLWSPTAWRDIWGREPADLLTCGQPAGCNAAEGNVDTIAGEVFAELEALAARILFLRVTVCFGWSPEHCGGRLGVCRVLE